MKCWIVDDEKNIVDYLFKTINWRKYGFQEVVSFTSSKEVLFRIEKGESPNLLLTDIRMPEVSGLDLAQRVDPLTKVVIISGYSYICPTSYSLWSCRLFTKTSISRRT